MTRWEKLNRKAIEYSLAIKDFMVMHGAKEESAKTIAKIMQLTYMAGVAEADKTKWTEDDEELYQDALDAFEALANNLNPSEDWGKLYDWIKSIKQRMEEQQ